MNANYSRSSGRRNTSRASSTKSAVRRKKKATCGGIQTYSDQGTTSSGADSSSEHRAALREPKGPMVCRHRFGSHDGVRPCTADSAVTIAFSTLCDTCLRQFHPDPTSSASNSSSIIQLVREEEKQITSLKGSYAGAMGLGQFIPSSYRNYAVDFDGDGYRDIWENEADAIGSVANYLNEHGWQRDADIALPVEAAGVPRDVFNVSLEPSKSIAELEALGVVVMPGDLDRQQQVTPMRFVGKQGDEFWLGMRNFYVITRYNHSELYAMAVYQLSENLRKP